MLNSRTPVQGWGAISTIPEGGHFSSINQKPRSQTDAYAYKMDGVSTSNSARKLTGSIPGGNGDDENDVRYGDVDRSNTVLRIQVERETTSDAVQHKVNKRRVSYAIIQSFMALSSVDILWTNAMTFSILGSRRCR